MKTSVPGTTTRAVAASVRKANQATARIYAGEPAGRQPVHTVYGGAQLFAADAAPKLGQLALKALRQHAPQPADFAATLELPEAFADTIYRRVVDKLEREPVEDFRIDFEDGFGNRPDAEEDYHAVAAAEQTAAGLRSGTLPPFIGIRVKSFSSELFARSARTLDLFVSTLARRAGRLPPGFVVTLPKITSAAQVAALARLLGELERRLRLAKGALRLELMIETTQSIFAPDGRVALRDLVAAAGGRCVGAHFGTYDYTAGCQITAAHQHMAHPSCDFAKHVMQVALSGTGVALSDGATNVMPVGEREAVHRAWRLHFEHVQHSLRGGFYQGWDLHPAQLPTRYAAVYAFFLEGLPAASARLKNFIEKAAQATLVGEVFDDAATGQGLLNYFLRGRGCGAIGEAEAAATGLSREELASRSFLKILEHRRGKKP